MNTNGTAGTSIDIGRHLANRDRCFPPEELAKYAGEEVAFSADGSRIVAHGKDFATLWDGLKAAGIDPSECVWAWIPPLDGDAES